jgi:hypothetical protein
MKFSKKSFLNKTCPVLSCFVRKFPKLSDVFPIYCPNFDVMFLTNTIIMRKRILLLSIVGASLLFTTGKLTLANESNPDPCNDHGTAVCYNDGPCRYPFVGTACVATKPSYWNGQMCSVKNLC